MKPKKLRKTDTIVVRFTASEKATFKRMARKFTKGSLSELTRALLLTHPTTQEFIESQAKPIADHLQ